MNPQDPSLQLDLAERTTLRRVFAGESHAPAAVACGQVATAAESPRLGVAEIAGVMAVFLQVALVAVVMIAGGLETAALRRIVVIAAGAFVIHHFLPARFRLPFFVLVSLGGLAVVMGGVPGRHLPDLTLALPRTAAIVAVGAGLIGLCHLPIAVWKRAVLLLGAGLGLAFFRAGAVNSGSLSVVWPVLAGMFMFRLIGYFYEVATAAPGRHVSRSLAYFFLLPNACSLLFPVVDFRAFSGRYYDEPALVIYQRGARWMLRGVVQILLYHFVNLTLAITAADVADGTDLIRYVATNSFYYVRFSGEFHLLVGLLLLFGFNLPETNHRYFLAASFTDYWRRVNTYWREFMMRVFYYPAFFRLKKLGQTRALVLATAWTFLVTWALHLYQAWWVTGHASMTWADSLFWTLLALLVLAGSLWELKRGRKRRLTTPRMNFGESAGLVARTVGTFAVISFLWSLWSAPSIGRWLHIWSLADRHTLAWGAAILAVIAAATLGFEVLPAWRRGPAARPTLTAGLGGFRWSATWGLASLTALCMGVFGLVRLPASPRLPDPVADARSVVHILRREDPPGEARGYYERLTEADPANEQYWEAIQLRKFPFHYDGIDPVRQLHDFPFYEPLPNVHLHAYDTDYETNRWGLRGPDCDLQAAPGTVRIALLGSSHVMGWGLPANETFGAVLERRLNRDRPRGGRFEILNFAVPGYSPLAQITVVRDRARQFHPNVVIHVAHVVDFDWVNRDAFACLQARVAPPDAALAGILRAARVTATTNPLMATERLRPYEPAMLLSVYREIVRSCRAIDALPVCVIMPLPRGEPPDQATSQQLAATARAAGFSVIDLSKLYAGLRAETLEVHEPGRHSNALAHQLVAAALYRQLIAGPYLELFDRATRIAAVPNAGAAAAAGSLPSP